MRTTTTILGISCFFHDSAACLVREGSIVAAAQEERFTRQKHDSSFPVNSINYCLEEARCGEQELDFISFYEQPPLALDRLIRTSFKTTADIDAVRLTRLGSSWGRYRLNLEALIARHVSRFSGKLLFSEHHLSHACSAFFRVYPGFPTLFWGLSVFLVGDLMGKALSKLVENAARFPRRGGRDLCVHGGVSFHIGPSVWAKMAPREGGHASCRAGPPHPRTAVDR